MAERYGGRVKHVGNAKMPAGSGLGLDGVDVPAAISEIFHGLEDAGIRTAGLATIRVNGDWIELYVPLDHGVPCAPSPEHPADGGMWIKATKVNVDRGEIRWYVAVDVGDLAHMMYVRTATTGWTEDQKKAALAGLPDAPSSYNDSGVRERLLDTQPESLRDAARMAAAKAGISDGAVISAIDVTAQHRARQKRLAAARAASATSASGGPATAIDGATDDPTDDSGDSDPEAEDAIRAPAARTAGQASTGPAAAPPAEDRMVGELDTGHYDDGHAFGWGPSYAGDHWTRLTADQTAFDLLVAEVEARLGGAGVPSAPNPPASAQGASDPPATGADATEPSGSSARPVPAPTPDTAGNAVLPPGSGSRSVGAWAAPQPPGEHDLTLGDIAAHLYGWIWGVAEKQERAEHDIAWLEGTVRIAEDRARRTAEHARHVDETYRWTFENRHLPPMATEFHDGIPLTAAAVAWYREQLNRIQAAQPPPAAPPAPVDDGGLTESQESALGKFFSDDPVTTLVDSVFSARDTALHAERMKHYWERQKTAEAHDLLEKYTKLETDSINLVNGFLVQLRTLDPDAWSRVIRRFETLDDIDGTVTRTTTAPYVAPVIDDSQPLDTGHYDDAHGFGWRPPATGDNWTRLTADQTHIDDEIRLIEQRMSQDAEDADEAPGAPSAPAQPVSQGGSRKLILVGGGALAFLMIIGVAIAMGGGGDDKGAGSREPGREEAAEPAATASTPARVATGAPISWSSTLTRSPSNVPCYSFATVTITITNGAAYAGKPAVVIYYGDTNFPDRPKQTVTIGSGGTFQVPLETTKCGTAGSKPEGVALYSVDGNTNVIPNVDLLSR